MPPTETPGARRPSSTARHTTRREPAGGIPDPGAVGDMAEHPPRQTPGGRAAAERSHARRAEEEAAARRQAEEAARRRAEEERRQAEEEAARRQAEEEAGEEDACIVDVPVWRPARLCDTIDTWGDKIVAPWPVCAGCSEIEDEKGSKGVRYQLPAGFRVRCVGLLGLYDLVKVWDDVARCAYYSLWVGLPAEDGQLDVLRVTYTGQTRGAVLTASIRKRAAAFPGRLNLRAEVYDLIPYAAPYEHRGRMQSVLMPMVRRVAGERVPSAIGNEELIRALDLAKADCAAWLQTFTAGRS